MSRSDASVSVTLESGTVLEGQLLVAADGSRSSLGTQCGVEWRQQPYGQVAVIANVSTAAEHNGRAFERFTQHGPLAMLPMSDGRRITGLMPWVRLLSCTTSDYVCSACSRTRRGVRCIVPRAWPA